MFISKVAAVVDAAQRAIAITESAAQADDEVDAMKQTEARLTEATAGTGTGKLKFALVSYVASSTTSLSSLR